MSDRIGTIDLSAPLPLGYIQAVEKAFELRRTDPLVFTYPTIAAVIRIYHGFDRAGGWYQDQLRGRVEQRPRGVPFSTDQAAA